MKKILLCALIGLAVACTSSRHGAGAAPGAAASGGSGGAGTTAGTTSGSRDGSSYENAVVIKEKTETKGVDAEYKWCAVNYPGYKRKMQALDNKGGKLYDVLTIVTADGTEKKVYFDISNFFGKF